VSFLEQNLADDYMGVGGLGTVTDKSKAIQDRKDGSAKLESIELLGDQKVRVHGNTALASGTSEVKGTYKGQDISGKYRYTRVYLKEGGKWKIVNWQATRVPPSS
jgi:ketosteroid isomerase-like protein